MFTFIFKMSSSICTKCNKPDTKYICIVCLKCICNICAKPGDENYCVGFCGEYYVEKNDEIMTIVEIEGTSKTTENSKRKQANIISLFGSSPSVVKKRRYEDITSGIRLNEKYGEKVSSSSIIEMSRHSDDNLT